MKRQLALFALGLAFGAGFLALALRDTDSEQIFTALGRADWWLTLPFLLALFLFYWVKTWRWRILLGPSLATRTATLFPAVMIGYAGSTVLPMQLGEVLRIYVTSRRHDLAASTVLATIALERIFDLLTILVLLGVTLLFENTAAPVLREAGYVVAAIALTAVAFTTLIIGWSRQFLALAGRLAGVLPEAIRERVMGQVRAGTATLATMRDPRLLAAVSATSFLQWVFMWLCCYLSLAAFDLDVPISAAYVVLSTTIVAVTFPSSPGFVGNIQFAYTLALTAYGVSAPQAFAASVYYHTLAYLSVLIVGGYCFLASGYSLRQLRAAGAQTAGGLSER